MKPLRGLGRGREEQGEEEDSRRVVAYSQPAATQGKGKGKGKGRPTPQRSSWRAPLVPSSRTPIMAAILHALIESPAWLPLYQVRAHLQRYGGMMLPCLAPVPLV